LYLPGAHAFLSTLRVTFVTKREAAFNRILRNGKNTPQRFLLLAIRSKSKI
jgi:hypothetical protein